VSFDSVRTDRDHPNTVKTVERTLINAEEQITPEDILQLTNLRSAHGTIPEH
jgi:hypothetical protein